MDSRACRRRQRTARGRALFANPDSIRVLERVDSGRDAQIIEICLNIDNSFGRIYDWKEGIVRYINIDYLN